MIKCAIVSTRRSLSVCISQERIIKRARHNISRVLKIALPLVRYVQVLHCEVGMGTISLAY